MMMPRTVAGEAGFALCGYTPRAGRGGADYLASGIARTWPDERIRALIAFTHRDAVGRDYLSSTRYVVATSETGEQRNAQEILVLAGPAVGALDEQRRKDVLTWLSERSKELGRLIDEIGTNWRSGGARRVADALDGWEAELAGDVVPRKITRPATAPPLPERSPRQSQSAPGLRTRSRGIWLTLAATGAVAVVLLALVLERGAFTTLEPPAEDARQLRFEADVAAAAGVPWATLVSQWQHTGLIPLDAGPELIRRKLEENGAVESVDGGLQLHYDALLAGDARRALQGMTAVRLPGSRPGDLAAWRAETTALDDWAASWRGDASGSICPAFATDGRKSRSRAIRALAGIADPAGSLGHSGPAPVFMTSDDVARAQQLQSLIGLMIPPEVPRAAAQTLMGELADACRASRDAPQCSCRTQDQVAIEDALLSMEKRVAPLSTQTFVPHTSAAQ